MGVENFFQPSLSHQAALIQRSRRFGFASSIKNGIMDELAPATGYHKKSPERTRPHQTGGTPLDHHLRP
jgi:hypothetical protein